MHYQADIYIRNTNNSSRFALGMSGKNPLYIIGLNPSTADDQKADQTIKRSMGFAQRNGFDGFIMLNIYPKRTPHPNQLDKRCNKELHQQNLKEIITLLKEIKNPSILAAWGEIINVRPYLRNCLNDLVNELTSLNPNWLQIGNLTKSGHPRHPSRAAYAAGLHPFYVNNYLNFSYKDK